MTFAKREEEAVIGGFVLSDKPITFNENLPVTHLTVRNTGDRPIQIGSHFHFFEANKALAFDRSAAFGKRLNIASTTAIRFEPGDELDVSLIPIGGKGEIHGFNNLLNKWVDGRPTSERLDKDAAIKQALELGYKTIK